MSPESIQSFIALAYAHGVEGTYAAPEYGGNAGLAGWRSIRFDGDRQPLGYVDPVSRCELAPVSGPESGSGAAAQLALDPAGLWRIVDDVLAILRNVGRHHEQLDGRIARTVDARLTGPAGLVASAAVGIVDE